jgi:hypothetical protein
VRPIPEWQKVREHRLPDPEERYPWSDRHDEPRARKPGFATPAAIGGAVVALAAAVGLIAWASPTRQAPDRGQP